MKGADRGQNGGIPPETRGDANHFGSVPLPPIPDFSVAHAFTVATLDILGMIERGVIKNAKLTGKTDLFGRVAIANFVSTNGDIQAAAKSAGILQGQLKQWIERAEKEFAPGLSTALTPEGIASMILPPKENWPVNLSFSFWSSLNLPFKPAVARVSNPPTVAKSPAAAIVDSKVVHLRPLAISAPPAPISTRPISQPANSISATELAHSTRIARPEGPKLHVLPEPGFEPNELAKSNPVQFLREKIVGSFTILKRFFELEATALNGFPAKQEELPDWPIVREAYFFQIFGTHQGNLREIHRNFPRDAEFIGKMLAQFGDQPAAYFADLYARTEKAHERLSMRIFRGYSAVLSIDEIHTRWKVVAGELPAPKRG